MTRPLVRPPRKNPILRTRVPTLPPGSRSRIALGLTAAAHLLAAMIGFVAAIVLMMYLAERRRSYVMQTLVFSAVGALVILFAFYAFRLASFSYVFTGGAGRFWFSLNGLRGFFLSFGNAPIAAATLVAIPVVLVYDLMLAAIAAAWLIRDKGGLAAWEKALLAALFALCLDPRGLAELSRIPIAPLVAIGVITITAVHALRVRTPEHAT